MKRRVLHKLILTEISAVDRPCQAHALAVIVKWRSGPPANLAKRKEGRMPESFDACVSEIRKSGLSGCDALSAARRADPKAFAAYQADGHVSRPIFKAASASKAVVDFQAVVRAIAKRDGCARSAAMSCARREHPELFDAYQQA
jgi:hypothetical protein